MIRAHLLQMDLAWEDRGSNFAKVGSMLGGIDLNPGDLVVLPELFDSGFSLNVDRTADVAPIGRGETQGFLAALARERGVFVHGSWTGLVEPETDARGLNIAALFAPSGEELYRYAKIHPFTYGREGERFDGGGDVVCADVPFRENESLRVCPAVCYDLRFPELFRKGLDLGAEVFVIGANWPEARQAHWRALSVARAIENQAWVLCVNRVGSDPHLRYAGGSMIVDPHGNVLQEGDARERVLSAVIDTGAARRWRDEFPAWRDRADCLR